MKRILVCITAFFLVFSVLPVFGSEAVTLSDDEFVASFDLAFMDGISQINTVEPMVQFVAVMTNVPEKRMGSAQWFIDGAPLYDYYSSEFPIYNGRITAMDFVIPDDGVISDKEYTIALEVHLNGNVKKIEKKIVVPASWYEERAKNRILSLVQPMNVEATVTRNTTTYSNKYLSGANGSLSRGTVVYYSDHYSNYAAYVTIPSENRSCWVPYYNISVSGKDFTVEGDLSDSDKELFVKLKEYTSKTPYLVWVNLQRQRVNIFLNENDRWNLIRVCTCSTGANISPTPTGVMTYQVYENGWYNSSYFVRPVMHIIPERGIAFHSILFNPNGTVQDGTQGKPVSHGCIRMMPEDINWMACMIPKGTTVVVF